MENHKLCHEQNGENISSISGKCSKQGNARTWEPKNPATAESSKESSKPYMVSSKGAAVIEIDRKTGLGVIRAPPTKHRVLKGGKWETVKMPGAIISRINADGMSINDSTAHACGENIINGEAKFIPKRKHRFRLQDIQFKTKASGTCDDVDTETRPVFQNCGTETKTAPPSCSANGIASKKVCSDKQTVLFDELSEDKIQVMEKRAEERRRAETVNRTKDKNEGELLDKPKRIQYIRGEMAEKVIREDNLRLEGSFYDSTTNKEQFKDQVIISEKVKPVKHLDNLHPEGMFYGEKEKMPEVKSERSQPIKYSDNLKLDGEFLGERIKMPVLNGKSERSQLIRQTDNLNPEGNFYGEREKMSHVKPVERIQLILQKDNLKSEGQFYGEKDKMPVYKLERNMPIKYEDQLKPEGEFFDKPKITEWLKGERADKVVHEDNLRMEGEFHDSTVNKEIYRPYEPQDRVEIGVSRPVDNLKQGGTFEGITMTQEEFRHYTKGDRAEKVIHKDTLKMEGTFLGKREKMPEYRTERTTPIKYKDELVTEGPFYAVKDKMPVHKPVKSQPIKQPDNLKQEGKFLGIREKMPELKPERCLPIKQPDNLKPEGNFYDKPTFKIDRLEDQMKTEGEFCIETNKFTRSSQLPVWRGDRYGTRRHQTTLKLEGDQFFHTRTNTSPQPRSLPIRPQDNLKLQGELNFDSLTSAPFRRCTTPVVEDRPTIRKHQDSLKFNGELHGFHELGLSPGHLQRQAKERRSLRCHSARNVSQIMLSNNLNSSTAGDLFRTTYSSSQAYRVSRGLEGKDVSTTGIKGESLRAAVVRHSDNLTVGEGSMFLDTTTKSQQRAVVLQADKPSEHGQSRRHSTPQSQKPLERKDGTPSVEQTKFEDRHKSTDNFSKTTNSGFSFNGGALENGDKVVSEVKSSNGRSNIVKANSETDKDVSAPQTLANASSATSKQNGITLSSHQIMANSMSPRESRSSAPTSFHRRSNSIGSILRRPRETIGSTLRSGTPESSLSSNFLNRGQFEIFQGPSLSNQDRFTPSSSSYGSHFSLHHHQPTGTQQSEPRSLPWRVQKIQRPDNLTVGGGAFDSLTSSRSSFRRHKIDPQDRVVPLRVAHQSNISFG